MIYLPFGGVEGIILSDILLNARSDVRILGNFLLEQIPELKDHIIPVDPFNIDRDFANVVDGLVWVDLLKTDPKILRRLVGEAGVKAFLNQYESDTFARV